MSKGADDETDMEAGMTTSERRRRRRRGAGLRIPSDNVPRRSGPVTAPVPEDPAVAMAVAYAFTDSDDSSKSQRLPTGDGVSDLGDLEDSTAFSPPPEAPEGSLPGVATDDVVPDGRTRQMAAISLEALGLTDLESAVAESNGAGPGPGAGDVDIDVDSLDDASDDAAPDDDDDAPDTAMQTRAQTDDPGDDFGESEAPIQRRPATIPPPVTAPQARVTERMLQSDLRPPPEPRTAQRADASGVHAPGREAPQPAPQPRLSRASTVALSEDDLEELLEATPPPQGAPQPPAANAPAVTPAAAAASAVPQRADASGVQAIGREASASVPATPSSPVVASASAAPVAPAVGNTTGEAVALAEEDLQEVASPADASDSGEILADEIVEVEQETRAAAVVAPPKPPAAPKKPITARHVQAAAAAAPSPDGDRKKRRGKPWFEDVFDEDYLRTLPFLTPQATQAEAMMVIDSLGVQAGAAVLDVGCGYGRHAMELAARGFHVVGVDLSLPLLLRGADEAQRRGLDINFVHADMREMDFDAQFDGAYCLFSTFGYFDDETNKKTASLVAKALKPGAKFMLEMLNRDYVIGDLPTRVWWEGDGCVVLEEVEFNYFSSRVQSKRSVVFDDGRQIEQEISVRVYSLHEVGKLLHAAGLRVLEVSGSMAARGRFLGNRSREIIVVAERRPPDSKS